MDLIQRKRVMSAARRQRPASAARADRVSADLPTWLERARSLPDIRWNKVAPIREAIEADRYDVEARLSDLLAELEKGDKSNF